MTRPLRRGRRADRFAQLLDEADGGRRHHVQSPHDDELADLVALRRDLAEVSPPAIDPEFRTGLRAMLVATAEREGVGAAAASPEPQPRPQPARRPVRRTAGLLARGPRARTAVIAGVTVGAVAFAGMSTASENAVPGDALYGVKRSTERAQLALASSDVGRAQLYLDFAHTRVVEAGMVGDGLDRVLDDMDRDTTAGVKLLTTAADSRRDPAALDPIDGFLADQRRALDELAGAATGTDLARVEASQALLDDVEERAVELRRNLDLECPSATSIDALGPEPGDCLTLPAPSQLDPSQEQPPAQQPEEQPDGADQEQPAGGPAQAEPDPSSSGEDDPQAPSSADDAETDPDDEEPAPDEDTEEDEDDGIIDGLNRLLGNLLGG